MAIPAAPLYCPTLDRAYAIYGSEFITTLYDLDRDGVADEPVFLLHSEIGSRQLDSYLMGQYLLPLENPPLIFEKLSLDISNYNVALLASRRSDEIEKRAEMALRYLESVGKGLIALAVTPTESAPSLRRGAEISIARADEYAPESRQFTPTTLRGLL